MGCIGADACPMPEGEKWLSYVVRCKADRSKPWSMTAVTITVLRWNQRNCLSKIWLYAGTSEYPKLLMQISKNAIGAENQQERLKIIS